MKLAYAPRAIRDLRQIGTYYRTVADDRIAVAVAERIEHVIGLVAQHPEIAPRLIGRSDVRVALVQRYPYKIFYRLRDGDTVEILHIRHTARRPWEGTD